VTALPVVAGSFLHGTAAVSAESHGRASGGGHASIEPVENRGVWRRAYYDAVEFDGNQTLLGPTRTDDGGSPFVGSGERCVGVDDADVDSFDVETDTVGRVEWERSYSTYGTHDRVFCDGAKVGTERYLSAGTVDGPSNFAIGTRWPFEAHRQVTKRCLRRGDGAYFDLAPTRRFHGRRPRTTPPTFGTGC
jgi:hypothetical protein